MGGAGRRCADGAARRQPHLRRRRCCSRLRDPLRSPRLVGQSTFLFLFHSSSSLSSWLFMIVKGASGARPCARAHAASAAPAHRCRCKARNGEGPAAHTPDSDPEVSSGRKQRTVQSGSESVITSPTDTWSPMLCPLGECSEWLKSLARTLVLTVGDTPSDSPTAACPACHDHAYMPEPALFRFACPVHVISRPRHDADHGLAAAAELTPTSRCGRPRAAAAHEGRATSGRRWGRPGDAPSRLQQLGLG